MTRYLLDANIFIQARNLHYGFDFCPAFREWLIVQCRAGKLASIEKVDDELQAGSDDLSEWARQRGRSFFMPPDDAVIPALGQVSGWAMGHGFEPAAPSRLSCKWPIIDWSRMPWPMASPS